MLLRLELENYRGFSRHAFDLRELSVVVGYNNAGKSTIVEALRILGVITARLSRLNFSAPPPWTNLPLIESGVTPAVNTLAIQFSTISNRYSDEPARIRATFASGEAIHVWLSSDAKIFAHLRDADGKAIRSKGRALKLDFPSIDVLPQIAPLEQTERVLMEKYVRRNFSTPLSSKHFRNQLKFDLANYRHFWKLAEDTWKGIRILQLEGARGDYGTELRLLVRDRDFVAEVGFMGHGLQMWLQTIWFLCRSRPSSTVVLDEPDVYMHPDLQRRLVRYIKGRFPQVIIATHSVEIVGDLDPSEILIVDRTRAESKFADTLPAVQRLIDRIGGIHNVHLARLWSARRCILVEGDDLSFLKTLHDKLYPNANFSLDEIPNSPIGGWDGWPYAIGQTMMARNALGQTVRVYCIFDSDYQIPAEIQERKKEAGARQVELHIWSKKEIENYFLDPNVIARVICNRNSKLDLDSVRKKVQEKTSDIVVSLENVVFDAYATRFRDLSPSKGVTSANRSARGFLGKIFENPAIALERVSGKEVLRQLSSWVHQSYGRGVSLRNILREIQSNEIHQEVRAVIEVIENSRPFS